MNMPETSERTWTRDELLNVAQSSPAVVARHDKAAWLALFAAHAVVEDPVGTAPHRRGAQPCPLDRFYETFIAPNAITFHVTQDIVVGCNVVRDVVIEIQAPTGMVTRVPTYVLYELTDEQGELKIARLAAYWALPAMVQQVLSRGVAGIRMTNSLGLRMLRLQRLSGIWGYMQGFMGIGERGQDAVGCLADAVRGRQPEAMAALFDRRHRGIEFPAGGAPQDPAAFARSGVELSVTAPVSAGYATAFRFETPIGEQTYRGIGLFEFDRTTRKIARARFFWDEEGWRRNEPPVEAAAEPSGQGPDGSISEEDGSEPTPYDPGL